VSTCNGQQEEHGQQLSALQTEIAAGADAAAPVAGAGAAARQGALGWAAVHLIAGCSSRRRRSDYRTSVARADVRLAPGAARLSLRFCMVLRNVFYFHTEQQ
jgi:hypothetical protein